MNWTEIEAKWTAMTRRVKSDHTGAEMMISDTPEQPPLLQDASDMRAPPPLDRPKN